MDLLASASWVRGMVTVLFVVICALLIIVILLQKGRGGGLAGAFGGTGGHSAFGAKTGDVFTWVTVALTGLFIVVAVVGNYAFVPQQAEDISPPAIAPIGPSEPGEAPAGEGLPAESATTTQPG